MQLQIQQRQLGIYSQWGGEEDQWMENYEEGL